MFFVNIWFKTNWAFNVWTVVRHAFAPQSVSKPANVGALNISKRCVRSSKAQGRGCIMCCVFIFSRDLCPIRFCGHATCHSCDYGHGMFFATMVTVCFCDHGRGTAFATMVTILCLRPWSQYGLRPWSRYGLRPWSRYGLRPWSRYGLRPWSRYPSFSKNHLKTCTGVENNVLRPHFATMVTVWSATMVTVWLFHM